MVGRLWVICFLLIQPAVVFAQLLEFSSPEKLPATINSSAEEGMPILSSDGKKLFFTKAMSTENHGGIYAGQDIWISEFSGTGWKKASNSMASINNKNNNVVAGLSKDGKSIFFVNASPYQKMNGIYMSRQNGKNWSRPQLISIPGIDNQDFIGFYVSPDLEVIFLSMKGADSMGSEDLYFTIKDETGSWSIPRNLGATINTSGYELSPFLSGDKKRLYFSSNGHGGQGDADIFYSERLYDSWETWSVPVNLGSKVNSTKFDAYFSIYGDSVAFFASNRDNKYADLYRVKVSQAKTILEKGQHYLSREEWNLNVGKNVSQHITFPYKEAGLKAAQQELLFYIVNKLMLQRDIRFHLVAREEEDPELTKKRLKALYDELKRSGIDPGRIYTDQLSAVQKTNKGVIEIQLFQ